MSTEIRYVCTGGCGGEVTEEELEAGKNKCTTKGCPHQGEELEKAKYCTKCEAYLSPEEDHAHDN